MGVYIQIYSLLKYFLRYIDNAHMIRKHGFPAHIIAVFLNTGKKSFV